METGETIVREFEDLFGLITMTERKWLVDRITAISPPEPKQGQIEKLRAALEAVQWAGRDRFRCVECEGQPSTGHTKECRVGVALAECTALRAMPPQDYSKPQSPKMRAETTPEMLESARRFVLEKPSTSYLQRKLMIGYNHACEIMEHFEVEGLVSVPCADGKRVVLSTKREAGK